MLTALKIILAIVLVVMLLAVLVVWWLIRKFKGFVKAAAEMQPPHPPCRINPQPEPNPQWRNPEKIKEYAGQFEANGFTPLGAFTLPEVGGLQLAAFVNEAERFYGVVYDHAKLPPNLDIVCDLEDGSEITGSNTKFGDTVDRRPETIAIRLDGGGVKEVLEALRAHPTKSPRKPTLGAAFAANFRDAYTRTMNWRMKRGGTTREEIRRQAEKDGAKLTDEQFEEVYREQRAAYRTELQAACIAQYLDEQKPTAAEWDERQPRAFAVPETFTAEEVRQTLEEHCELDEEQKHRLEQIQLSFGQTALDYMRQVVDGGVGSLGLKRLGTVQEPVPAEVYLVPECDNSTAAAAHVKVTG